MQIKVEKMSLESAIAKGVTSWPIWTKEVSRFDWLYDSIEECYLLEGDVEVTTKGGEIVAFGVGDFVTFEKGLSCTWNIKSPVKKHYHFL